MVCSVRRRKSSYIALIDISEVLSLPVYRLSSLSISEMKLKASSLLELLTRLNILRYSEHSRRIL